MKNSESAFLFGIFTAWANLWGRACQDRPATVVTIHYRLTQHPSNHRAAAPAAAGTRSYSGAVAYLLESLSPGPDRFEHGTFANLVAQAGRFEVFDDRLLSGLLF